VFIPTLTSKLRLLGYVFCEKSLFCLFVWTDGRYIQQAAVCLSVVFRHAAYNSVQLTVGVISHVACDDVMIMFYLLE